MSVTINGTNGLTFNDASTQTTAATGFGFKNRIINGAMVIDQRNAGASVTPTTNLTYTLDRWVSVLTAASKYSVQQNAGSVTPPTGFTNYLGVTSLSAYSIAAGDLFSVNQRIEGFNAADLAWGTASAQTVTLSFWVRSSLTGTFGGCINNSAANRTYLFTYAISAANTWEQKTITIAGDVTGTWLTTSGIGIEVRFGLGAGSTYTGTANTWSGSAVYQPTGSVNLVATNGATFYITGVQLEKGSTATSFDYRPYGTELALCQRYYEKSYNIDVTPASVSDLGAILHRPPSTSINITTPFKVAKRASPSVTVYSPVTGTSSRFRNYTSGADLTIGGVAFIGMWGASPYSDASTANNQYAFQFVAESEL